MMTWVKVQNERFLEAVGQKYSKKLRKYCFLLFLSATLLQKVFNRFFPKNFTKFLRRTTNHFYYQKSWAVAFSVSFFFLIFTDLLSFTTWNINYLRMCLKDINFSHRISMDITIN